MLFRNFFKFNDFGTAGPKLFLHLLHLVASVSLKVTEFLPASNHHFQSFCHPEKRNILDSFNLVRHRERNAMAVYK